MATKSFIKEFAVDRKNAHRIIRAFNFPKHIVMQSNTRVEDVKKDQILNFFKMDV
ncbi:hypothetical protein [Anaerospora sp.]|uniref:hypothetical protein n=1 Tax=Anaerospora sp. TaxID=1960278 RepID=UPI00289D43F6|nr:hypothetical protein [Anaerospora sp.]